MTRPTKIVIASVLKPVDDVRSYKKIACSLVSHLPVEVVCIGTGTRHEKPDHPTISFWPWPRFRRLSPIRFLIPILLFIRLLLLRPRICIINTHELLVSASLYRRLSGCKLIYDIREDYATNLLYQENYPWLVRRSAARVIRFSERICSSSVHQFFLAEDIYAQTLDFIGQRFVRLSNKSLPISRPSNRTSFNVVITGTLSAYSRTIEAIQCFLSIKHLLPKDARLLVVGHVPSKNYHKQLMQFLSHSEIDLDLSRSPLPHDQIVQTISMASLAIIGYAPNKINEKKIPTKLYEYRAAKIPYLVETNSHWHQVGQTLGGAIPVTIGSPEGSFHMELLNSAYNHEASTGFLWSECEDHLIASINYLNT